MITGELRNKVDQIWQTIWTGGITSPITVLEQITYLMFMKLLDEYFAYRILSEEVQRMILGSSAGSTVSHLNVKEIRKLQLPLPPIGEQRKFAAFVAEVDKSKVTLRETVATLDQLYRAKLQEYFG